MYANVFYENGVGSDYLEATKLAYEALGSVKDEVSKITFKPLEVELPLLRTGQVDSAFINQMSVEQGVSALIVTRRDLGAIGLNYCFGRSVFDGRSAILSAHRVESATMFGLALHELGHSEGLVSECEPQYDQRSRFAGHCMNLCVMRPVNTIDEMDATIDTFMRQPHTAGFCMQCADALHQ